MSHSLIRPLGVFALVLLAPGALAAQVDLEPTSVKPAAWERFALRVVNQNETPITHVTLTVPEVLMVLGVEPIPGWSFDQIAGSESTPPRIAWSGGELHRGEYLEFALLARVPSDARRRELVFPVRITRADESVVEWSRTGGEGVPPRVQIVGTTSITAWGSVALASVAVGIAVIALALSATNRRKGESARG